MKLENQINLGLFLIFQQLEGKNSEEKKKKRFPFSLLFFLLFPTQEELKFIFSLE